ncbi:MAG: ABC transporter permease [Verrucomicrobia bacterium]|nr:ABC transporter permease [Verrucomicrobiota bacterium]
MNFFTELREGLAISWSAIRANKLRSVLTTLGIVIGIVTVTLMGTAIQGLNNSFMNSISTIGADVLYVDQRPWIIQSQQDWIKVMKNPRITLTDVEVLQRHMNTALAIAPVAQDQNPVVYQKRSSSSVPMLGTTEQFQSTSGMTMAQGRFLSATECEGGRPVCVIGANTATNLFLNASPLGEKILVEKHEFEVVGVLEKQGGFSDSGGADDEIIFPLPAFLHDIWQNPPIEIQVKAASLGQLDDTKEELRTILRRFRHIPPGDPDNFSINQQDQFLELFHAVAGTIAGIGLFITGLSLFVGGIGIMNIMFVSVAERTREIGVRKAIGAKNRTILLQFIIEAACICLIGGVIALLIAWPATLLLQKIMPATLSLPIVGISLLVSALTGILSGFFPAWRAARMNTVDALRNE